MLTTTPARSATAEGDVAARAMPLGKALTPDLQRHVMIASRSAPVAAAWCCVSNAWRAALGVARLDDLAAAFAGDKAGTFQLLAPAAIGERLRLARALAAASTPSPVMLPPEAVPRTADVHLVLVSDQAEPAGILLGVGDHMGCHAVEFGLAERDAWVNELVADDEGELWRRATLVLAVVAWQPPEENGTQWAAAELWAGTVGEINGGCSSSFGWMFDGEALSMAPPPAQDTQGEGGVLNIDACYEAGSFYDSDRGVVVAVAEFPLPQRLSPWVLAQLLAQLRGV